MDNTIRRRRALGLVILGVVVTALSFGLGHRGVHAVRSLLVPGAGLYDHRHLLLGIALTVASIAATYAWLKWGMDWLLLATVVGSMVMSAALAYQDHPAARLRPAAAAHEFPLVVLVMAALSWVRMAWRRSPLGRLRAEHTTPRLSSIDGCRAEALTRIACEPAVASGSATLDVDALTRRCRRVGIAARARFRGDPLRTDHAHVRAALVLAGLLEAPAIEQFRDDAARSLVGVPGSEPGWVRLLDGTLAAVALSRAGDVEVGDRWSLALSGPFELRHGHRPSAVWTPVALRGPRGATWEHTAATGLARAAGWIPTDEDWQAVRTRAFAAAARGSAVADDERLVAASRIWLALVDDDQAARILGRVTVHLDPIAVALAEVADALVADPHLLTAERATSGAPAVAALLQPTRRIR